MSIFRRDTAAPARSPGAASPPAEASSTPRSRITQIAPGSRIKGEVTGATELLVLGEIEGTIRVEATVEVGASGVVKGPITAQVVRASGKVIGNLRGTERVEVGAAAVLRPHYLQAGGGLPRPGVVAARQVAVGKDPPVEGRAGRGRAPVPALLGTRRWRFIPFAPRNAATSSNTSAQGEG